MMQRVPETLQSIPSPGGEFALRWDTLDGADIQSWQLVRCDYPLTQKNGSGLLSGGLDLMVTRWELHPSVRYVVEDTGACGKHYVVIGIDPGGQLHMAPEFDRCQTHPEAFHLSEQAGLQGWIKTVKKGKDRYSNVF